MTFKAYTTADTTAVINTFTTAYTTAVINTFTYVSFHKERWSILLQFCVPKIMKILRGLTKLLQK